MDEPNIHFKNLFETGTGNGSTSQNYRSNKENKMFFNLYKDSPPIERPKYGVLNIFNNPKGVSSCYGYGKSFFVLKKIRLRTTFTYKNSSE